MLRVAVRANRYICTSCNRQKWEPERHRKTPSPGRGPSLPEEEEAEEEDCECVCCGLRCRGAPAAHRGRRATSPGSRAGCGGRPKSHLSPGDRPRRPRHAATTAERRDLARENSSASGPSRARPHSSDEPNCVAERTASLRRPAALTSSGSTASPKRPATLQPCRGAQRVPEAPRGPDAPTRIEKRNGALQL